MTRFLHVRLQPLPFHEQRESRKSPPEIQFQGESVRAENTSF
jgi:hypothetical protein